MGYFNLRRRTRNRFLQATSLSVIASCVAATPVSAQVEQDRLNPTPAASKSTDTLNKDIIVTGSSIRGVAPVGSTLTTVTAADIATLPALSTTDLLRQLPQIGSIGPSESGSGGGATRGQSINIRGIGPEATLFLVNGRRVAPSGFTGAFNDPSVIPVAAIERIEVVADGASAIYGSDAIAGVVNIIYKKHFTGAYTSVRAGGGQGFDQHRISQAFGLGWSSGNVMIVGEQTYRGSLGGNERARNTSDLRSYGGADYRSTFGYPGNIVAGGVTYPVPNVSGTRLTASQLAAGPANRFDNARQADILPRQKRNSVVASISQDIAPWLTLRADGFWTQRDFSAKASSNTSSVTVPNTNPYFVSPVPGATSVSVNYNFAGLIGPRNEFGYARNMQANVGADLKLFGDWLGDVTATYSKDHEIWELSNQVRANQLTQLVSDPNPATTLNVFGNGLGTAQATLDALRSGRGDSFTTSTLKQIAAKFNGSLIGLPGGEIRGAIGAEYRKETQSLEQFVNYSPSFPDYANVTDQVNSRSVSSVFGELFIPLVGTSNAMKFVRRFDISLAARGEHYSDFGNTVNPKAGLNWKPDDSLTIHASYGRSFRAPLLPQLLSKSGSIVQSTVVDPLAATGRSIALIYGGGNANLKPTKAQTWSFGADYKPRFISGLQLSANYFHIAEKDIVGSVPATAALSPDLYSAYVARNPTPAQISAILNSGKSLQGLVDPSQISMLIDTTSNNLGSTTVAGIDGSIRYQFNTPIGTFAYAGAITYYTKYANRPIAAAPETSVVGTINFPARYTAQSSLSWSKDGFRIFAQANRVASYQNNLVTPVQRVSPWTTVDMTVSYSIQDSAPAALHNLTMSIQAQNLFNTDAPFVNNPAGYSYDSYNANIIGRVFSFEVSKKW